MIQNINKIITKISLALFGMALLGSCAEQEFFGDNGRNKNSQNALGSGGLDDFVDAHSTSRGGGERNARFGESLTVPSRREIDSVITKCATATEPLKEKKQLIEYKQRSSTCRFGTDGNLEKKQAFIRAYEANPGQLELPTGTVCDVDIKSLPLANSMSPLIRYDDFLILTLDAEIIFFSNASWMQLLDRNNGIFRWDFKKIIDQEIGNKFEAGPYCLVRGAGCQFPGHDKMGPVNFNLRTADIAPIVAKFAGRTTVPLVINVTGDNNDSDCIHTPLTLEVTLKYAP